MNTEDQFKAQKKALEFQEMYYPGECLLKQRAQSEAIRFAFAQGFEMAQRAMRERLNQALRLLEDAKTHIEDNCA
jgi:DNA polymerase III delta subunit